MAGKEGREKRTKRRGRKALMSCLAERKRDEKEEVGDAGISGHHHLQFVSLCRGKDRSKKVDWENTFSQRERKKKISSSSHLFFSNAPQSPGYLPEKLHAKKFPTSSSRFSFEGGYLPIQPRSSSSSFQSVHGSEDRPRREGKRERITMQNCRLLFYPGERRWVGRRWMDGDADRRGRRKRSEVDG